MAQLLDNVAVGSIVKLKENGIAREFYVSKHDYESSLNGTGRTLVVRKDVYDRRVWNNDNVNAYASSDLDSWFNSTYKNMLDADIHSLIGTTKIHYTPGNGNWTVSTLERAVFALSATELGQSTSWFNVEGSALPIANTLKVAYLNGSAITQWTRSPRTNDTYYVAAVQRTVGYNECNYPGGSRPAFTLPSNMLVDDSNNIVPFPTISSITAPSLAMQGQSIPLSWTPVSLSGFDVTYQLQRNADNGGWTTIYTGANTSYTDTAGTWTQVQYQVAAVVSGAVGSYTQSNTIPVSDPAVLVISGQDGNLGTLISNISYTVSSNTGNPISLIRTVNGAQVVTLTVNSGFAYSIPVADLPTGTGTIQITASVENTSQEIQTQTRTWTYYKTPINIPSTGGIAQLTQNGQNIWPVTVPDAVQVPAYLGGNLNAALNKLGQAALYTKSGQPKYTEVTVDLSTVNVGDEVLLPENNVMVPHLVVNIGNPNTQLYDSSCNGVWLLRTIPIEDSDYWNNSNTNSFTTSKIMTDIQSQFNNYNSEVQSAINQVKIPYIVGGGSTQINSLGYGFSCHVFPLSVREINSPSQDGFPQDGSALSYFETFDYEKTSKYCVGWTRSSYVRSSTSAWYVGSGGGLASRNVVSREPYVGCIIMSNSFSQTYYVDGGNNVHPSQEYTQGGSITDVFGYDVPIAQYEFGSYVGTGSSSDVSLTFNFVPKIVIVQCGGSGTISYDEAFPLIMVNNNVLTNTVVDSNNYIYEVTWNNKTLTFGTVFPNRVTYNRSATYNYIAIG